MDNEEFTKEEILQIRKLAQASILVKSFLIPFLIGVSSIAGCITAVYVAYDTVITHIKG